MGEIILVLGIIGLSVSVPIVAILTHHQRKMAAIVQFQRRSSGNEHDVQLSREIAELREIVAQQAIVLDDISSMHRRLLEKSTENVQQRLNS